MVEGLQFPRCNKLDLAVDEHDDDDDAACHSGRPVLTWWKDSRCPAAANWSWLLMITMMMMMLPATVEDLVGLVNECRQRRDVLQAKRLHAHIIHLHLGSHHVLGNCLVPMLVNCGSLRAAQHVFNCLSIRTEHAWSSLISGYVDSGDPQHALSLYHDMQHDCIHPTIYTFLALLRACARLKDADSGHELHAAIVAQGLQGYQSIANTIMAMYSKRGSLLEAQHAFDKIPSRDVVSWNVLVGGYAERGEDQGALNSFKLMELEGVTPDCVTYVCAFKACGSTKAKQKGQELHMKLAIQGLEKELLVGTTLVDMYAKCGLLEEAEHLFDELPVRDAVLWTALLAGYTDNGLPQKALDCFDRMNQEGISLDANAFVCSLKACGNTEDIKRGEQVCTAIVMKGMERDLFVGNALVDMYVKCNLLAEAQHIFDNLIARDVVSWNTLITGYAERGFGLEALNYFEKMESVGMSPVVVTFCGSLKACGMVGAVETSQDIHSQVISRALEGEPFLGNTLVDVYAKCRLLPEARRVFDKLPVKNAVSWSALMSGYAEHGLDEEVLKFFDQMQLGCVSMDAISYVHCLQSCGTLGALEKGREVHAKIRKAGLERDVFVANTLIDMYGKCGSMVEGREVFDNLLVQGVISWNALIKGYGENHQATMAVQCFDDMLSQGVKPDSVTYTCVLAACSHASLVDKGQDCFEMMKADGIEPKIDHIICMVDLLGRSGRVHEAVKFVEGMRSYPSEEILRALLGACKTYGDIELGQRCFQQIVQVNAEDAAVYLLMADLYVSAGRCCDADRIEEMRVHFEAKKKPASASIEVNKRAHVFAVGDNHGEHILAMLDILGWRSKVMGFVPNLEIMRHTLSRQEDVFPYDLIDSKLHA